MLLHLVGLLGDLLGGARGKAAEKDLQIALRRRRSPRPARQARWEQLTLAALTARLVRLTNRPQSHLAQILLLVQPRPYSSGTASSSGGSGRTVGGRRAGGRRSAASWGRCSNAWPQKTRAGSGHTRASISAARSRLLQPCGTVWCAAASGAAACSRTTIGRRRRLRHLLRMHFPHATGSCSQSAAPASPGNCWSTARIRAGAERRCGTWEAPPLPVSLR